MKTIILATDFSKNAAPASEFALRIAMLFKCRLMILHVYEPSGQLFNFREADEAIEDKNKVNAQRKLYRLRKHLLQQAGIPINIMVVTRSGNTLETIKTVINEQHTDLLVMGTAGAKSPGMRYFGSQATEMILKTNVPLLLVPPKIHFTPFKNIVVAIDLAKPVDACALDNVIRFSKAFEAILNIICVNEDPSDPKIKEAAEHIRNLIQTIPHTMSISPGHHSKATILKFAEDNEADLLMMLPQSHNALLYSVLESHTQEMARLSDIPVLAVV